MAVVPADITVFAPRFSTLSEPVISAAISQAERRMSPEAWGSIYDDGVTLLACHILMLRAGSSTAAPSASGPLSSVSVGSLSKSFAVNAADTNQAWLASSAYGLEYMQLRSEGVFGERP